MWEAAAEPQADAVAPVAGLPAEPLAVLEQPVARRHEEARPPALQPTGAEPRGTDARPTAPRLELKRVEPVLPALARLALPQVALLVPVAPVTLPSVLALQALLPVLLALQAQPPVPQARLRAPPQAEVERQAQLLVRLPHPTRAGSPAHAARRFPSLAIRRR